MSLFSSFVLLLTGRQVEPTLVETTNFYLGTDRQVDKGEHTMTVMSLPIVYEEGDVRSVTNPVVYPTVTRTVRQKAVASNLLIYEVNRSLFSFKVLDPPLSIVLERQPRALPLRSVLCRTSIRSISDQHYVALLRDVATEQW